MNPRVILRIPFGAAAAAIVVIALLLRVVWLDVKPPHFDEGVNGWFIDSITRQGFYHYDPSNFHGPLHFYVLFVAQTLFGRNLWALRLPIALISTAAVAMVLAFRPFLGGRATLISATAMAVSPGMVFYGRYSIHESWLLLFLLLTTWGLAGLWHYGEKRHLRAAVWGAAGCIVTKETYLIHFVALLMTLPCLLAFEKLSPSSAYPFRRQKWTRHDLLQAAGVALLGIVFLYTGGLLDWPGPNVTPEGEPAFRGSIAGLWETYNAWFSTGTEGKSGHEKDWWYWLELLLRYEWPALIGLAAAVGLLWPRVNRVARLCAIYGTGALIGYSIIAYKTPWCLISLMWPFHLLFGNAVVALAKSVDRPTTWTLAAVALGCSFLQALDLNFRRFTDPTEPYVYVQTLPDIDRLLGPLRTMAARDPMNYHLLGTIVLPETHPLPWLLGDFTRVNFPSFDALPEPLDSDFLLIDDPLVDELTPKLRDIYFREPLQLRGNAETSATLFLRAGTFGLLFPNRTPEFIPAPSDPEPEPTIQVQ